jgi:hypothetical protein
MMPAGTTQSAMSLTRSGLPPKTRQRRLVIRIASVIPMM